MLHNIPNSMHMLRFFCLNYKNDGVKQNKKQPIENNILNRALIITEIYTWNILLYIFRLYVFMLKTT